MILQRIFDRFDRIPLWLRASTIGVAFLLMFALSRGALIVVPLLIVAAFIWSPTPWLHIGSFAAAYLIVLLGAAVGGLVYYFMGRHLSRIPYIGKLLAAYVSVLPYMYALLPFTRLLREESPNLGLPDTGEHVVAWGVGVFAAAALSYGWYREGEGDEES